MAHKRLVILTLAAFFLAMAAAPAWGHDFNVTGSFNCLGSGCSVNAIHADESPWKGWAYFTLSNTGTEDWGDFHFELFQVPTYPPITNTVFDVTTFAPQSSQNITWTLSPDGHTLDLYFYGDPVAPGNTATFNIYTDNSVDNVTFFGTLYYPTPIPEPSTFMLVGFGLLGMLATARRLKA